MLLASLVVSFQYCRICLTKLSKTMKIVPSKIPKPEYKLGSKACECLSQRV
jgi:hypothetical protein